MVVDIEAQKRKIKQMLRKAEDPASSEHEREAFTEAAEKMMLRLGIEMAELESVGERKADPIVQVALAWRGSYSIAMIPFVCRVADGFGNLTILQSTFDDMLRVSYVIGHQSDVEQFQQLVSSLHLQVMSALKVWQREHRERRRWFTDMEKYTENRSFILGFGSRVGTRLRDLRNVEEQTASTGAALVLRSKQHAVDAWVSNSHPDLKPGRGGMKTDSWAARAAGAEAGENARLSSASLETRRRLG